MSRIRIVVLSFSVACLFAGCSKSFTEFEAKEHNFKAMFPGTPKTKKQMAPGGFEQTYYIVEESGGAYSVVFQRNPGELPGMERMVLDKMKDVLSASTKIKSTKELTLDGKYPGIELSGEMPTPPGTEMRNRVYLVGDKLYQVMIIGKPGFVSSGDADKFLDSFKYVP
jgi:hypothetical protein